MTIAARKAALASMSYYVQILLFKARLKAGNRPQLSELFSGALGKMPKDAAGKVCEPKELLPPALAEYVEKALVCEAPLAAQP